ncbi:MAG TPA: glycosyl hydrolase [Nitrolancea sp.]|nr:glycosyl hydrolase [Nitrolancea sp.]
MTATKSGAKPQIDPELLKALRWRLVGPFRGGRVVAVAGDPVNSQIFYFGSTGGGVWKTYDGGRYWENVSDGFFKRASVGGLAVAQSDPNVIYAGMGEATIRGNVSHGDGVYKSTDAGKSWTHVGLEKTRNIGKVRVHPENPDLVYVAAFGHAHGNNPERGVYRSKDGGTTWELVLFRNNETGAIDLTLDPTNPRIIYASFWQAIRQPWELISGGEGSGIFKTTDGGDSWTEISRNEGLPKGVLGKIGISASAAQPGRVYAVVEAEDGAVFRSDDYGETWQRGSEDRNLRQRAWYYHHIIADPTDPDTVWLLNVEAWKSTDAGRTFEVVAIPHGDNHDLWIDPKNPLRMIEGNDGGGLVSFNGGQSWSDIYNQPTAEFYHVSTDMQTPYRIYGAQQDNTTMTVLSRSSIGAITRADDFAVGGGESGYIQVDPRDPNIIYAGSYGGFLTCYNHSTGEHRMINVWPENTIGSGAEDARYRFQWTYPIVMSPHNPDVIYVTSQFVHRTTNGGSSWEILSPDLTRGDPETLKSSGGPITKDNTGAEYYATIFAFAESKVQAGLFWAGSDDGLVFISQDNGKSWQNINPPDLPDWALVSIIEPSPHDPATAYLAATRYKLDDFAPYFYKTNDYGKSWVKINDGIPADECTRVIREDPNRRGLLYGGTEAGIYVSFDDGAHWQSLRLNLPVVPIHDLEVKDTDLVAATHGRSFWVIDDVTPLHQLAAGEGKNGAHVFKPRTTVQYKTAGSIGHPPSSGKSFLMVGATMVTYRQKKDENGEPEPEFLDAGKNPPDGVIVFYSLGSKPTGEVKLTFLDSSGSEIKSFVSKPDEEEKKPKDESVDDEPEDKEPKVAKEAGLNRFVWDMRYPDADKVPGDKSMEFVGGLKGPVAVPGSYTVRLTVGNETSEQSFEIVKDPRSPASQADLQAQFDLLTQIRDKVSETHNAINRIRRVRDQVDGWQKRAAGTPNSEQIAEAAKPFKEHLTAIEEALIQVKAKSSQDTLNFPIRLNAKVASLARTISGATAAPTAQAFEAYADLAAQVDARLNELNELLGFEGAAFSRRVQEANIPAIDLG